MTFRHEAFCVAKPEHERLLRQFAELRGQKTPAKIWFLPPTGIIVFHKDEPICLGFMIKCDNGMAINSDFLSDPAVPKKVRNDAVNYMRAVLCEVAKRTGFQFVTAFTKHEKLAKKLCGLGFKEIDRGFIQVGRFLWL